jgi:hypothetical protein
MEEKVVPKFNLNTRETVVALGSTALFRRLRHYGWLKLLEVSRPGRPSLYPMRRIEAAQKRLEAGEFQALLPCESRMLETILPLRKATVQIDPFQPVQNRPMLSTPL